MIEYYPLIKQIHIATAMLSITGFLWRAWMKFTAHAWLQKRITKTLPHMNDTVLMACGIAMAVMGHVNPLQQHWLLVKLLALLGYIACGIWFMRYAATHSQRIMAFLMAVLCFSVIVLAALTRFS